MLPLGGGSIADRKQKNACVSAAKWHVAAAGKHFLFWLVIDTLSQKGDGEHDKSAFSPTSVVAKRLL